MRWSDTFAPPWLLRLRPVIRGYSRSMTPDWRDNGVRIVHAGELDPNTPQTAGMSAPPRSPRREPARRSCGPGRSQIQPDAKTGAHHHGPVESVIYVVSGAARMRWGERLRVCRRGRLPATSSSSRPTSLTRRSMQAATSRCRACSCVADKSRSSSTSTCPTSSPTPSRFTGSTTSTARRSRRRGAAWPGAGRASRPNGSRASGSRPSRSRPSRSRPSRSRPSRSRPSRSRPSRSRPSRSRAALGKSPVRRGSRDSAQASRAHCPGESAVRPGVGRAPGPGVADPGPGRVVQVVHEQLAQRSSSTARRVELVDLFMPDMNNSTSFLGGDEFAGAAAHRGNGAAHRPAHRGAVGSVGATGARGGAAGGSPSGLGHDRRAGAAAGRRRRVVGA